MFNGQGFTFRLVGGKAGEQCEIYLMPAIDHALKNGDSGKFYLMYILPQFKKWKKITMKFNDCLFHFSVF